jgi:hypothetical protein
MPNTAPRTARSGRTAGRRRRTGEVRRTGPTEGSRRVPGILDSASLDMAKAKRQRITAAPQSGDGCMTAPRGNGLDFIPRASYAALASPTTTPTFFRDQRPVSPVRRRDRAHEKRATVSTIRFVRRMTLRCTDAGRRLMLVCRHRCTNRLIPGRGDNYRCGRMWLKAFLIRTA